MSSIAKSKNANICSVFLPSEHDVQLDTLQIHRFVNGKHLLTCNSANSRGVMQILSN